MRNLIFVIAILTAGVANGQSIIASQREGAAASPLPQVVQEMNDAQYRVWAEWHNAIAQRHAKAFNESTARRYHGWVTTHSSSDRSSATMHGSQRLDRQVIHGRSATNTGGTSTTMQVVRTVPGQSEAVLYFNPFCKTKTNPATRPQPNWGATFAVYQGKIMSVNEIVKTAPRLSPTIDKERLYRLLLKPPTAE